ncbi:hypothetical protein [Mycobacterium sp. PSTR-4-N]|uniref:hypothetical protein n=1 Tax=Mycobacterium sp. PSTR-4-N TaxID=2917745 RepID=UPI001F156F50|nr:hypothetical protein [Mycobacterium sp. PSTR-4-N]MCG7594764.1 hypothetical protein [Mycobacterium sp. PSTR-4-N]
MSAVLLVIAVAATAAIAYAIARPTMPAGNPTASPAAPTFTAAQQADAKQAVCQAFDVSSAGSQSQGGARLNGQPNLPALVRTLGSVVSIQNALVPATPEDVAAPARKVVKTDLDLVNAALGLANVDEVNRLTDVNTSAIYQLVDACGLPK